MTLRSVLFLLLAIHLPFRAPAPAENWPQWRGPRADGVSLESGLPEKWSAESHVVWKAATGMKGYSSPIVWGDRIFLSGQIGLGPIDPRGLSRGVEPPSPPFTPEFLVRCYHRLDGRLLWEYKFRSQGKLTPVHPKHNLASPSPVTDGERVYVWFGSGRLLCLNTGGRLLWERRLNQDYGPYRLRWGHGSSPVLAGDRLILLSDHSPGAYLLALNKHDGRLLWRTPRAKGIRGYSTPLFIKGPEGPELVVNSQEGVDAYDPRDGHQLWSWEEFCKVAVPSPIEADGILYFSRGYSSGPYMALRLGRRGRIDSSDLLWRNPTGAPYVSSLLHYRGLLYMASERGVVSAVDPSDGRIVWKERLGGYFSASPLAAEGKIYLFDESGDGFVLRAGREFRLISRNSLGERIQASPAVSGGRLFVRTDRHLYAIGR